MEDLRVDVVDHVAVVSIDRPPVNALRAQTFREISEIFDGFAHRRDVRVAILTAAGERAFCAGVDLNDSARRHSRQLAEGDSPADLLDPGAVPRTCFESVLDCAVGAGVALAASCDVLVASTRARFALTEIDPAC